MATIISFVQEKGGAGKTTLALNFIVWLSVIKDKDVLLIDADPSENATTFTKVRNDNNLCSYTDITKTGDTLEAAIMRLKSKYDFIVIDTGGRNSDEAWEAMCVSDLVVIPIVPGQMDVWSGETTLQSFAKVKKYRNPKIRGVVVANKVSPNPMLAKDGKDLLNFVKEEILNNYSDNSLNLYPKQVHERIIYKKVLPLGMGVVELSLNEDTVLKRDKKAENELNTLFAYIMKKIHQK